MFCRSCGKEISDNTTVCPFCRTTASGQKQKQDKSTKTFIAVAVTLAVAVLAALIITKAFGILGKSNASSSKNGSATENTPYATDVTEPATPYELPSEQYV